VTAFEQSCNPSISSMPACSDGVRPVKATPDVYAASA
jgi:hypothetical protein